MFLLAVAHGDEPVTGSEGESGQSESGLSEEGATKCVMFNQDLLEPTNLEEVNKL